MEMKKVQFIIISTILSFGLIVSAALLSNAIHNANRSENKITVKGVAEKRIKADKALINIVLSTSNTNLEEAKKNIMDKEAAALNIVKLLELKNDEYQIGNVKILPKFSNRQQDKENKILSYDVSQSITIMPKNIDKVDNIYEKFQELKWEFNNIQVTKPEYYITGIEKYKKDLLVEATKNAEYRALEMLKVNNNEIDSLENIVQGQFETLPDKEDISRINENENNQMFKKLRSVITATYLIKY